MFIPHQLQCKYYENGKIKRICESSLNACHYDHKTCQLMYEPLSFQRLLFDMNNVKTTN